MAVVLEDGVTSGISIFSNFIRDHDSREVVLIDHVPYPVLVRVQLLTSISVAVKYWFFPTLCIFPNGLPLNAQLPGDLRNAEAFVNQVPEHYQPHIVQQKSNTFRNMKMRNFKPAILGNS